MENTPLLGGCTVQARVQDLWCQKTEQRNDILFLFFLFQVVIKNTMCRSMKTMLEIIPVLWHLQPLLFWYFAWMKNWDAQTVQPAEIRIQDSTLSSSQLPFIALS